MHAHTKAHFHHVKTPQLEVTPAHPDGDRAILKEYIPDAGIGCHPFTYQVHILAD